MGNVYKVITIQIKNNMKLIITLYLLIIPLFVQAQSETIFEYDKAGNRICRRVRTTNRKNVRKINQSNNKDRQYYDIETAYDDKTKYLYIPVGGINLS